MLKRYIVKLCHQSDQLTENNKDFNGQLTNLICKSGKTMFEMSFTRYLQGIYMVFTWYQKCLHGIYKVFTRYLHSIYMVFTWYCPLQKSSFFQRRYFFDCSIVKTMCFSFNSD